MDSTQQTLTHMIPIDFKSDLCAWSSGVEWGWPAEQTKLEMHSQMAFVKIFVSTWLNFQYKMYALMCACPTSSDTVQYSGLWRKSEPL